MTSTPTLITAGVIAAKVNAPLHCVVYVLKTRPHIQPRARAGTLRLYDQAAIEAVRQELNEIAAGRLLREANNGD